MAVVLQSSVFEFVWVILLHLVVMSKTRLDQEQGLPRASSSLNYNEKDLGPASTKTNPGLVDFSALTRPEESEDESATSNSASSGNSELLSSPISVASSEIVLEGNSISVGGLNDQAIPLTTSPDNHPDEKVVSSLADSIDPQIKDTSDDKPE